MSNPDTRDAPNEAKSSAPQTPTRYGDYEIVKPIGKGKFAIVYRAKRLTDDSVVALKRINVDSIDDKARDKTLKEVGFLQSLDHPNVIRYMDSFITDNDLVIVFEWAAAGDLKRQLRKAQERGVGFEERVIWKYFSQVCDAIQHMHERRIMHRDLKPANIFLTIEGIVKVGDLGLSREMSENTVQAHSKVGTPLYMSPEVLKGDGYDFKSDIWSLGCILYELAMLKSPFKAEGLNLYSLFQKISSGDYQPLPENYSEELRNLAYAMISTKPEDRPDIDYICETARSLRTLYSEKNAAAKRAQQQQQQQQQQQEQDQKDEAGAKEDAPAWRPTPPDQVDYNPSSSGNRAEEKDNGRPTSNQSKYTPRSIADDAKSENTNITPQNDTPGHGQYGGDTTNSHYQTSEFQRLGEAIDNELAPSTNNNRGGIDEWTPSRRRGGDTKEEGPGPGTNGPALDFELESDTRARQAPQVTRRMKPNPQSTNKSKSNNSSGPGQNHMANTDDSFDNRYNSRQQMMRDNETETTNTAFAPQPMYGDNNNMDNGRSGSGGGGSSTNGPRLEMLTNSAQAFAMSETIYNKLVVLGFPLEGASAELNNSPGRKAGHRMAHGRGRLLPYHFATDLTQLVAGARSSIAGYDAGQQYFQFRRFVETATWVMKKIGGRASELVSAMDMDVSSPVMICKQLLIAAGSAGVKEGDLVEITPTSLSSGYGNGVCLFLLSLTDILHSRYASERHRWVLSYPNDDDGTEMADGEDGDDDDEEEAVVDEDDIADETHVHDKHNTGKKGNIDDFHHRMEASYRSDGSPSRSMGQSHQQMDTTIDPKAWREETERVAPLLAKARQGKGGLNGYAGGEWGDRLTFMQKFKQEFENISANQPSSSNSNNASQDKLVDVLSRLGKQIDAEMNHVSQAEKMLNVRESLASLVTNFSEQKTSFNAIESAITDKNARLGEITEKLAILDEALEEQKESLEGKFGGEDAGTSQATRIRSAIKKLKEDIAGLSVSIGMTEHSLLRRRQASAREMQKEKRQKMKDRKHKHSNRQRK